MTFPIIERNNNPMLDAPTQALLSIILMETYERWEVSYNEITAEIQNLSPYLPPIPTAVKQGLWNTSDITIGPFESDPQARNYLTCYLRPKIPAALMEFIVFKLFQEFALGAYYITITPKTGITEQLTPSPLDTVLKATFTKAKSTLDYAVLNVNGSRNKYFYSSSDSGQILHYFIDTIFQGPTLNPTRVQQAPRTSEERTISSAARTVLIEERPSLADTAIFSSITDALMLGIGLLYLAISSSLNVFVNAVILAVDLLYLAVGSSIALLERTISMRTRPLITDAITHSSETVSVEGDRIAATTPSSQRNTRISLSSRYRALLEIIRANRIAMEQSFSNIGTGSSATQAAAVEAPNNIAAVQTVTVSDLSEFTEAPTGSPETLALEVHEAAPVSTALVQTLEQETAVAVPETEAVVLDAISSSSSMVEVTNNAPVPVAPTALDLALLTEALNDNAVFAAPVAILETTSMPAAVVASAPAQPAPSNSFNLVGLAWSMASTLSNVGTTLSNVAGNVASNSARALSNIATVAKPFDNSNVVMWDETTLLRKIDSLQSEVGIESFAHFENVELVNTTIAAPASAQKPKAVAPEPKERSAELEMR